MEPPTELDIVAKEVIMVVTEVHKWLGPGFLESVYENAMCVELERRGISFARQVPITVEYKGVLVGDFRADLLVADSLVVELKAAEAISSIHLAQLLSYLKATSSPLGLVINFNVEVLLRGVRRVVLTPRRLCAPR